MRQGNRRPSASYTGERGGGDQEGLPAIAPTGERFGSLSLEFFIDYAAWLPETVCFDDTWLRFVLRDGHVTVRHTPGLQLESGPILFPMLSRLRCLTFTGCTLAY